MRFDLGFGELKSPEVVYYDIITYVLQNINTRCDCDEIIATHPVNYYKYCNYTVKPYVYTSDIKLSHNIHLNFYFSYKRSYISIYRENDNVELNTETEATDFAKLQYLLLIYCDKILLKYCLGDFIYNLG
jgi:hypothetical protein